METATLLSGIPLFTKFRLLLPGWPGRLCPERQPPAAAARRAPVQAPRVALDTPPPPPPRSRHQASGKPGTFRVLQQQQQQQQHSPPQKQQQQQRPAQRGSVKPLAPPDTTHGAPIDAASEGSGDTGGSNAHRRSRTGDNGTGEYASSGSVGGGGHDARASSGGGGGAVWAQVRGADLPTWAELVRQYGTKLGGAFAANALFRAAHFVDGSGALLLGSNSAATRRLADSKPPPPPPPAIDPVAAAPAEPLPLPSTLLASPSASASSSSAPPQQQPAAVALDGLAFSSLVQLLLGPAAEAAAGGQLDGVRCCRLLWALAKLSGGGGAPSGAGSGREASVEAGEGSEVGLAPAQEREGPPSGPPKRGQETPRRPKPNPGAGPALPRSAMRHVGSRCAAAAVAQLMQQLSAAEAQASGGAAAATGPDGTPGAPWGLNGRLLVMAMWGLARLTSEGHLRHGASYGDGGAAEGVAAAAEGGGQGGSSATVTLAGREELWDGLCGALRVRLGGLSARELSNGMWAMAAARYCRHPLFGELAEALTPHLEAAVAASERRGGRPLGGSGEASSCNVQDVANAVWALARAGLGEGSPAGSRLLGLAEAAVLCALPQQLQAQHVASLLWSLVMLRYRPRRRVAAAAAAAAQPPLPASAAPQDQEQQQQQQSKQRRGGRLVNVYELLAQRVVELRLVEREDEGIVAQVVWALAKERLADDRLLGAAAVRLREGAGRLSLREAAMVASAYRMARYPEPGLFSALLRRAGSLPASELSHEVPHADVSIALLLRGLAWAGAYDKAVYSRLCDALHRHHLPTIQPQPLALTLWALAEAGHRPHPPAFLAAATTLATALSGRFSGGELSCAALSLARLGVRDPVFFGAAAVTLTALRGGGGGGDEGGGGQGRGDGGGRGGGRGEVATELVPGEAAPVVYGEEEDDEEEDDVLGEEDEEAEEAEEGEEEEEPAATEVSAAAGRQTRTRRRGGRRYWLPAAAAALRSRRWRRIDLLNPQELANVMAAFAISGHVDEMLYYRVQIRTRRLLKASSVLRRDAAAGGGGDAAAALARGDPVSGADMSAAAVTKLLWSFVAVGVQETSLLSALAARLRQQLQRLEPRDIAALAWALATSRLPGCGDLLARTVHAAAEHARAFAPADLTTVAWAAASVGLLDPALMEACARLVLTAAPAQSAGGAVPAPPPSLKVLSDVAWAHSALRLYDPRLLAAAAELAAARLGDGGTAATAPEATATAPWLPPELELGHVVALLEAHATWAAGAAPTRDGGGDAGGGEERGSSYHDGLFRAAAWVLLSRLDELTSDEVVTLTWCCTAVLHHLPPGDVVQHQVSHPVLQLLAALSELLAATPADSFLQPELAQLAQAHALSVDYAAAAAAPAPAPLVLPAALARRAGAAWDAAPAARTRRLVAEMCAALDEMGFGDVRVDARSEDGLVPVDVSATRRPPAPTHGSPRGDGDGAGAASALRYAFVVASPEMHAVGQLNVLRGTLGVRVRLLRRRGWDVVVVPAPPAGAGGPPSRGGGLDAGRRREYVRELLRGALAAEGSVRPGAAATWT